MSDQKVSRREFLRMAAVATAAGALAACKPAATPTATSKPVVEPTKVPPTKVPATKAPPPQGKVELWIAGGGTWGDRLEAIAKDLASTGITIEVARASGGWKGQMERINTAIAAGTVPGLAHIKDYSVWEYARKGALLPVSDYFAASTVDTGKMRKPFWEAAHYKDTVYGVPFKGSFLYVLFTNDQMFADAGLDPEKDVPKTWQELVEVSQKLTNESKGTYGHAFYEFSTREVNLLHHAQLVGQAGGRIFSDDLSRVTLDTPEGNEALQWQYDMLYKQKSALPAELMTNKDQMTYENLVGTWIVGPWFVDMANLNAPKLKWSLHKLPCYKTCDNTDQPEFVVMFKGVKNPDLSWAAAELLLNPDFDPELSLLTGALPIYTDSVTKGGWATNPVWQKFGQLGLDPELRPRWYVEGYEEVAAAITPELQTVQFNQKGVKQALVDAEKAANDVLARVRG